MKEKKTQTDRTDWRGRNGYIARGFYEDFKKRTSELKIYSTISTDGTFIEITHKNYNKATAVENLFEKRHDIGLVISAGDNLRDSDMHLKIREIMEQRGLPFYNLIIEKSGTQDTEADYKLESFKEFLVALGEIVGLKDLRVD